jgi:hypothetical protein
MWFVIPLLSSRYIGGVRPVIEDGVTAMRIPRATIADASGAPREAVGGSLSGRGRGLAQPPSRAMLITSTIMQS